MERKGFLSPLGPQAAAGDACSCSHPSPLAARGPDRRGRTPAFRRRTWMLLAALACCVPGVALAQHRGGGAHDALNSLTCTSSALTGAASDACTVSLSSSAGESTSVELASSSTAVKVPGSVTVAAGAKTASFTATASAVSRAQTVTLTASESGSSERVSLQLKPASTGTAALTLGSTSVAFGSVGLNTPATQSVSLKSSGTAALTISAAAIKGTGFSMSGLTTPVTLSSGQTATLNLQFDPTAAGTDTGSVSISSNASGGAATISLSGTGATATAAYQVNLNWDAPAGSSDPVSGYNVYRATGTSGQFQLLNQSVNSPTTYSDTTVQSGTSYQYEVRSVDKSGALSTPSGVYSASIP